jgi:hypothetical protein
LIYQNAGRSHNIQIDNVSFARVEEFKYLGTALTNQNSIQVEIKSRSKSGNACYPVQNVLSFRLLLKNRVLRRMFGPKRDDVTGEWGGGGLDWSALAQDKDRCWALVKEAMNLRVP